MRLRCTHHDRLRCGLLYASQNDFASSPLAADDVAFASISFERTISDAPARHPKMHDSRLCGPPALILIKDGWRSLGHCRPLAGISCRSVSPGHTRALHECQTSIAHRKACVRMLYLARTTVTALLFRERAQMIRNTFRRALYFSSFPEEPTSCIACAGFAQGRAPLLLECDLRFASTISDGSLELACCYLSPCGHRHLAVKGTFNRRMQPTIFIFKEEHPRPCCDWFHIGKISDALQWTSLVHGGKPASAEWLGALMAFSSTNDLFPSPPEPLTFRRVPKPSIPENRHLSSAKSVFPRLPVKESQDFAPQNAFFLMEVPKDHPPTSVV